jgi:hypothetical protein
MKLCAKCRSRCAATLDYVEHPPIRSEWSRMPGRLATRHGWETRNDRYPEAKSRRGKDRLWAGQRPSLGTNPPTVAS